MFRLDYRLWATESFISSL